MFVIEDESHSEPQGEFSSLEAALAELRRRAVVPWNEAPNVAPCAGWQACGRRYEILETDNSVPPRELRRMPVLEVSAKGTVWITVPDALTSASDGA